MAATKGLGELFVELGLKGLGKTLGGLNAISAQFLLTKNAAEQAIKPILDFSKQGGAQVMAYEKINAVTGISVKRLGELDRWTKLNRIDFNSFANELGKLQQNILQWKMSGVNNKGFDLLGIDPNSLDWQNPEKAMKQLAERAKEVAKNKPAIVALAFQELGLSQDLVYAYTKANRELDMRISLSDKQLQKLEEEDAAWAELDDAVHQLGLRLAISAPIAEGLRYIIETTKRWFDIINDSNGAWTNFKKNIFDTIPFLQKVLELLLKIKGQEDKKEDEFKEKKEDINAYFDARKNFKRTPVEVWTDNLQRQIALASLKNERGGIINAIQKPFLPMQMMGGAITKTVIEVTQNINTNDPIIAGKQSASEIKQIELNNAKFNNGVLQ